VKRTKKNILANFVGQGTTIIFALICTPFYTRVLGAEGFGIFGLYLTVQSLVTLLDFGFSTTLNREIAASTGIPERRQHVRDLLHTMQVTFWCVAALIAGVIAALAPVLSRYWLRPEVLSESTIRASLFIMAPAIAFFWLTNFYSAGISGLQRQVRLNLISISMDALRFGGSLAVLWKWPNLPALFAWLALVNAAHCVLVGLLVWHIMPKTNQRASLSAAPILKVWRFAAGVGGLGVTAVLLTQTDKVLLSKLLSLSQFGYYSLAALVAGGLSRLFGPVYAALFPRFSQLIAADDMEHFVPFYHQSCQFMSVILLPTAVVLAAFSREVLFVWTNDPTTAANVHLVLTILALGTAVNGLMNLPYALQLAHGWTKLALVTNMFLIVMMIPLLLILVNCYGPVGAAMVWLILNSVYFFVGAPIMHRYLMKGELMTWYLKDICSPLIGILLVVIPARLLIHVEMQRTQMSLMLLAVLFAAVLGAVLGSPLTRERLFSRFTKRPTSP
jgi:O-antigen/teichoic acid export membrane protein